MGVTYKLRQDVVDFIVQAKKNNSSLSCRKLVLVVKEHFGIDVSKSSVNGVIKECNLSAPVGRHAAHKAPKNFSIPKDKKAILLNNVKPFLPTPLEVSVEVVEESKTEEIKPIEPVAALSVVELTDNTHIREEKIADSVLLLRTDPVQLFASSGEVVDMQDVFAEVCSGITQAQKEQVLKERSSVWKGDLGELYQRLGASVMWFVFKAACASSHLGDALERILEPLPEGVIAQQCEALLFASFFAEHLSGRDSDDLRTLWRLSGLRDTDGRLMMERLINHDNDRVLCIGIRTSLAMAFTPVRYFRLLTKKGARFYIDAASCVLHHEFIDAGQASAPLPIFVAVERAVDRFITNIAPFVADVTGSGLTPEVLRFIRLMESFGEDVLSSVELIGDGDLKCVEFSAIPLIRRGFILSLRLSKAEASLIEYDVVGNKKLFFDELSERSGSFVEGTLSVEGVNRPLRVYSVKPDVGEDFVLVTNIFGTAVKSEDILKQFFSSESANFMGMSPTNNAKNEHVKPQVTSLSEVYREVDGLIQRVIFSTPSPVVSWSEMCQSLYNLPGYIKEHPKAILIRLLLPDQFAYQAQLKIFLHKLNNIALKSPDGRRIIYSF